MHLDLLQPLIPDTFQTDSEAGSEAEQHPQSRSLSPTRASTPIEDDPPQSPSNQANHLPSPSPPAVPRSPVVPRSSLQTGIPAGRAQSSSEQSVSPHESQEQPPPAPQPTPPIAPALATPGPVPPRHPPIASLSTMFNPNPIPSSVQDSAQGKADDDASSTRHLMAGPDDDIELEAIQPNSTQSKRPLDPGAGGDGSSDDAAAQDRVAPPQKRLKADSEVMIAGPAPRGRGGGQARGNGRGRGKYTISKKVQEEAQLARGRGQGAIRGAGRKGKGPVAIIMQEQEEQEERVAAPVQARRVTRRVAAAAAKASAEAAAKLPS